MWICFICCNFLGSWLKPSLCGHLSSFSRKLSLFFKLLFWRELISKWISCVLVKCSFIICDIVFTCQLVVDGYLIWVLNVSKVIHFLTDFMWSLTSICALKLSKLMTLVSRFILKKNVIFPVLFWVWTWHKSCVLNSRITLRNNFNFFRAALVLSVFFEIYVSYITSLFLIVIFHLSL